MSPITPLSRFAWSTGFALVLASACGGKSFTDAEGGDAGSGVVAGSSAQGGATSQGGSHATAGKAGSATGGTSASGGASAGAGVGGSGIGGDACAAPAEGGPCDAAFPRWYHDPATGLCRPFTYGGCGGNPNNYESLAACQKACPGGMPNYDACNAPSDCTVAGAGCCGPCEGDNVTSHELVAYNKEYGRLNPLGCGGVACGACPPPPPDGGTLKYFVPDCVQGQCVVQDLRTSAATACKVNDDCRLRHGNGCCESCGGTADEIAVRNDGSFEKLVCGGLLPPCAACVPQSDGAIAVCDQSNHCSVTYPIRL